jgi:hypothetical protein
MWNRYTIPPIPYLPPQPVKRKVFISYCHLNQAEAENFVARWQNVFIPRALGMSYTEDIINSANPEYVMAQIRLKYLGDSSVTVVLVGTCTHSRRYVDWELKASLQRGAGLPNGVVAFLLPSAYNGVSFPHLPERFDWNCRKDDVSCYARYQYMPQTDEQMRSYIEDAFDARTTRADAIVNPNTMMKYNSCCRVCGITH